MLPVIIAAIENPEDRDLITDFYEKYHALLYSEARKYLDITEDVEDIVYEALTKIIDKMEVFRELKPLQRVQYAVTTVKNLSYILLRRNNHFTMVSFDDLEVDIPADDGISAEKQVEKKLFDAHIKQIWNELDLEEKMLLEQKYILKWKDEELATSLGIQPQSVRMRLTRAKKTIHSEFQKMGFQFLDWL